MTRSTTPGRGRSTLRASAGLGLGVLVLGVLGAGTTLALYRDRAPIPDLTVTTATMTAEIGLGADPTDLGAVVDLPIAGSLLPGDAVAATVTVRNTGDIPIVLSARLESVPDPRVSVYLTDGACPPDGTAPVDPSNLVTASPTALGTLAVDEARRSCLTTALGVDVTSAE